MKSLVNYCRWHQAKLRLRGREEGIIHGQLVFITDNGEESLKQFRFDTIKSELTIYEESGAQILVLDEMGVPIDKQ